MFSRSEWEVFEPYVKDMDDYLTGLFPSLGSPLNDAVRKVLEGGKRVRCLLALLSCESMCGDHRPAIPIAAAYELAHSAALIEDDTMDGSPVRRGFKTLWVERGLISTMLIVDALLFTIPELIAHYVDLGMPKGTLSLLLKMIGSSARSTAVGEYMDMELARKDLVDVEEYLGMARRKTGALLAASSACGAIVGNGGQAEIDMLYEFGENLGTAYQILDDVMDVIGDPKEMGKPTFTDIRCGKKNIVCIYSLQSLLKDPKGKEDLELLKRALSNPGVVDEASQLLKGIFVKTGAIRMAERLANTLLHEALGRLSGLKDSASKQKLVLLSHVVIRNLIP